MRLIVLLLTFALSGCAMSAPVQDVETHSSLETLGGVNAALAQTAGLHIELADGEVFRGVSGVVVSPYDVRFSLDGKPVALPIERVARITAPGGNRAAQGAGIGATPGLLLLGGILGAAAFGPEQDSYIGGLLLLMGGAVALGTTVIGTGFGAFVGSRTRAGDDVILYQAPVDAYLAPSATPSADPAR